MPVRRVLPGGWDNLTFRLGDNLLVRLPSAKRYAPQISREAIALDQLAGKLSVPIPCRVRTGAPDWGFGLQWAINTWVIGQPATTLLAEESRSLVAQCGRFLSELHDLAASEPLPGIENFHRGGCLENYSHEVEAALALLDDPALRRTADRLWRTALASRWNGGPRWVHGDFFPWNLLVDSDANLCGVIDWGLIASGDPACDLAVAWTCFDADLRKEFRGSLGSDLATWQRGRGWALWKALTLATRINTGPPDDVAQSGDVLARICNDRSD